MKISLLLIVYLLFNFLLGIATSNNISHHANYMKTFEMDNGNVLFCTDIGISLFYEKDGQMIEETKKEFINLNVTKKDFDFVTISQFEEGEKFIIILYKTMIYIFTSEGNFLTEENITFTPLGNYLH